MSKISGEGLSFNDVLIVPAYSEILPNEVNLSSRFSRNIRLKVPLVASPMDTVTGHRLAISIALLGGIGIVHRNMSISNQIEEIIKVKRHQSGVIKNPYTIEPEETVGKARELMKSKKVSGIPVIKDDGKLVGIVTIRDLPNGVACERLIKDIMTKDLVAAPIGTDFEDAETILSNNRIEKLPLVDNEGRLVGMYTQKDIENRREFPNVTKDRKDRLRVGAAVGVTEDFFERAQELVNFGADVLVLDSSHGHSRNVIKALRVIKSKLDVDVVAGNIATKDAAKTLIDNGADGLRVGIGPGSICTTRIVTGVGVPQLTAITECYRAAKKPKVPVIADGGIRYSGDITKAIVAGADTVMIGSLFAGTDEAPGYVISYGGQKYKTYRGMGSEGALKDGGDRYDAKGVPEGVEGRVPYRGSLEGVFNSLEGGLRQGMGLVGRKSINNLKNAKFMKITSSAMDEGHPHGVDVISES